MAGLKELARKNMNTMELEDILNMAKVMSDTDVDSDTSLALMYSYADARAVHKHTSTFDFQGMREHLNQCCEKEVIYYIKHATKRFVTIGGNAKHPMVIIDMLTREYRVMFGFGEERQGYHLALTKQGFKANHTLRLRTVPAEPFLFGFNPRFDASICFM